MIRTIASHPDNRTLRRILCALLLSAASLAPLTASAQSKFIEPTHDELTMTSLPGYPGVAAVILNKEEITKDDLHSASFYDRIKILTEDGKKYANVELPYVSTSGDFYAESMGNDKSLDEIQGRTIHPDGTVIPFTGKPYLKVMEKGKGIKVQAKVFTLPDVTVGSIIEYRYSSRINDYLYEAPDWIIQGDLYVKSAHYVWYPTSEQMTDGKDRMVSSISLYPILPKGVEVQRRETPAIGAGGLAQIVYEVTIKDVPPVVEEEFMPPIQNYGYRVYFNYVAERTPDEYWKDQGKDWTKAVNSFVNPNSELKSATQQIVAGATTQDQKLRAIYAAVQKLENTDYTRAHEAREDKANGLGKLNNAGDVFKRERGSSTQLTELFIGMARAAGITADAMIVPDRSTTIFLPRWLNINQFDDMIAVVNVDGKELFLDPGERYCPYGHLAWQHSFVQGMRQKSGNEVAFEEIQGEGHAANETDRVANLTMDETGHITGKIDFNYTGASALDWRHTALSGDDESLKHELRTSLEAMMPHTLEIKDITVSNVADYEKPLHVTYQVEGGIGTWTGKRLVIPADLFLVNHKATFPHEKRDIAVDFKYPSQVRDALRINFPHNLSVEAAPANATYKFKTFAGYGMTIDSTPANFTTRRDYIFGDIYVLPDEYTALRTFYSQLETNDQQSIVLKATAASTTTASNSPSANQ